MNMKRHFVSALTGSLRYVILLIVLLSRPFSGILTEQKPTNRFLSLRQPITSQGRQNQNPAASGYLPLRAAALFLIVPLLFILIQGSPAFAGEPTTVYFADIDGVIGVPMEEHVGSVFREVDKAKVYTKSCVLVFKVNTPGGLVDSMSDIITKIAESKYPVVVWVAPSGARAASAGAFIVQASHVAVMAPGSNIGAAHPVLGSGSDISDKEMNRKITNDLKAKMRSFAQERGRNVAAAESMVTKSVSLTAREALEKKVIDYSASTEAELIAGLEGRSVKTKSGVVEISVKNHKVEYIEMSQRLRLLGFFSRPDVAYLALIAGVFLLMLEVKAPGGYVMGVSGITLLLIASYGLRVLPVNFAGVALLLGGVISIVIDVFAGGVGLIALAGVGAMLFGGLMLFNAPGSELLEIPVAFISGVTITIGLFFLFIVRLVFKALRKRVTLGEDAIIGRRVTIIYSTDKNLMAMVHGEYWRVLPDDLQTELAVGDEVEIIKVESLILYVKLVKRRDDNDS